MFTIASIFGLIIALIAAVICFFVPRRAKPYAVLIVLAVTAGWLGAMVVAYISREPVDLLPIALFIASFLGALVLPQLMQKDLAGRTRNERDVEPEN